MENKVIGFFDSGLGGLTVLKEILKRYPNLDFVYFGDNKNAPYGQKSESEIIDLTKLAFEFLKEKKCKKIITACNSVSAIVNEKLAEETGIGRENILEMSGSTVKYCVENNLENILILSTEATKKSELYTKQFLENNIKVESVAVNGLVDLIESGSNDRDKEKIIKKALESFDLKKYQNIILACTHFPLVENIFKKVFQDCSPPWENKKVNFINPAVFVAEEFENNFGKDFKGNMGNGKKIQEFYFSDKTGNADGFVKGFLG